MLIEFSVTNFKSIQTTQTLSLPATPATELQVQNCFTTAEKGVRRLLRSIAIYGPNASGKSNLLQAINFMKSFVRLAQAVLLRHIRPHYVRRTQVERGSLNF